MFSPLYKLRTQHKLTMEELVQKSGLSKRTIVSIEHGRNARINNNALHKIANCFNVDLFEFYEEYLTYYQSLQTNNN